MGKRKVKLTPKPEEPRRRARAIMRTDPEYLKAMTEAHEEYRRYLQETIESKGHLGGLASLNVRKVRKGS